MKKLESNNRNLEESNSKLINNLKLTLDEHDIKEKILKQQENKIYELENKIKVINPSYKNLLNEKQKLVDEKNKLSGELEYYYHRMLYFQEKYDNYKKDLNIDNKLKNQVSLINENIMEDKKAVIKNYNDHINKLRNDIEILENKNSLLDSNNKSLLENINLI